LAKHVSAELAYIVEVERYRAKALCPDLYLVLPAIA
jgi:hypothetical protein